LKLTARSTLKFILKDTAVDLMELLFNRDTLEQYAKFYCLIYHRHYSMQS